jgi:hypothetical protein
MITGNPDPALRVAAYSAFEEAVAHARNFLGVF